ISLHLSSLRPLPTRRSSDLDLNPLSAEVIRKINDHPRIVHIEWSDHVSHYMAISDVLVHASHREGFPNVLLEAGAISCPIICSDIPGNTDLVSHQKTGLVYPVKNKQALKDRKSTRLNSSHDKTSY